MILKTDQRIEDRKGKFVMKLLSDRTVATSTPLTRGFSGSFYLQFPWQIPTPSLGDDSSHGISVDCECRLNQDYFMFPLSKDEVLASCFN